MKWLEAIIESQINEEGKLDITETMEAVKQEFPKQAVPKEVFNEKLEDLKTANDLVEDLKKSNQDVEGLQTKINDYEKQVADLEDIRAKEQREFKLTSKLKDYGAKDIDYMLYKLEEVEVEEVDNKIKELMEENPIHFSVKEEATEETKATAGYEVMDNKLQTGKEIDAEKKLAEEFRKSLG